MKKMAPLLCQDCKAHHTKRHRHIKIAQWQLFSSALTSLHYTENQARDKWYTGGSEPMPYRKHYLQVKPLSYTGSEYIQS